MSQRKAKYHFVLIAHKDDLSDKGVWKLYADTNEAIEEHWNVYVRPYFQEGMQQVIGVVMGTYKGHYTNTFAGLIHLKREMTGKSAVSIALELENETFINRLNEFRKGNIQLLGNGPAVMPTLPPLYEIRDEKWSDRMLFPDEENPTETDIRIIQWPGGEHYYAKVGSLDVVDEEGNQKWHDHKTALEAGKWFIQRQFNSND